MRDGTARPVSILARAQMAAGRILLVESATTARRASAPSERFSSPRTQAATWAISPSSSETMRHRGTTALSGAFSTPARVLYGMRGSKDARIFRMLSSMEAPLVLGMGWGGPWNGLPAR